GIVRGVELPCSAEQQLTPIAGADAPPDLPPHVVPYGPGRCQEGPVCTGHVPAIATDHEVVVGRYRTGLVMVVDRTGPSSVGAVIEQHLLGRADLRDGQEQADYRQDANAKIHRNSLEKFAVAMPQNCGTCSTGRTSQHAGMRISG